MTIDVKVLTALIGVSGTAIAAILGSFGYLYRNHTEHKKSIRKVLYLLLEIQHSVRVTLFEPDKATDAYIAHLIEKCRLQGIDAKPSDVPDALRLMIRAHVDNLNSSMKTDIETRLVRPFEEALMEMAQVNPILAFKIRGKEKLEALITHTIAYSVKAREQIDTEVAETATHNQMTTALVKFKQQAFDELVQALNTDILMLAKSSGWVDFRRCKQVLAEQARQDEHQYDFQDFDEYIDELAKMITEANAAEDRAPNV